jgi:tRNA-dihydrouridine synthase B
MLAPMAGVTGMSFRRLCREQGASLVFSEMVSAKALMYGDKKTESLLRIHEDEKPVAYQIFGREPGIMAGAARMLDARGNALLDINMGCPVPKVVKNGEGAALLREPQLAGRLVEAAALNSRTPVTVKIRAGWDGESVNAVEMARRLEAAGAAAISVHVRTSEQYFCGEAYCELIRGVREAVNIPVTGNGDIRSGADAVRMLRETGCDFVMIARGAMGNPWIFREAAALYRGEEPPEAPDPGGRIDMLWRHFMMLTAEKGEYAAIREMRGHAAWYLKGMRGAAALRAKVNGALCAGELEELLEDFRRLHSPL